MSTLKMKTLLASYLMTTLITVTIPLSSSCAKELLTENSKVWLKGIGPITVGMSILEAEQAGGIEFEEGYRKGDCVFLSPKEQPKNINFMALNGKIVSVHIYAPSLITTKSGIGIDSTEAQLKAAYPERIQFQDTLISEGDEFKIFAFVPKDAGDKDYRLFFTLHLGKIQDFAAGKMPQVKDRC